MIWNYHDLIQKNMPKWQLQIILYFLFQNTSVPVPRNIFSEIPFDYEIQVMFRKYSLSEHRVRLMRYKYE